MKKLFNYGALFLSLFILGCKGDVYIEQVYKKGNYLMQFCKDKALLKSRGDNLIIFKTFKNNQVNEYYVTLDKGTYKFERDTIQYLPDIVSFRSVAESAAYRREVCRYVASLDKKLTSLGIIGFRTDFATLGEPYKFYMKNGKTMVFIPNLNKIPNDKEYRKRLILLGDFWYFTE